MLSKAKEILNIISKSGGEARLVGGCVRDFLRSQITKQDLQNTIDIDIATNLIPDKITEIFESKKIRVIPTGIDFGTVTIVYESKNYEITTLRNDIFTDGRHAKVSFTKDWKEDASRRDFTFNALYMDESGKIYDYFNGQEDLKNSVVRFIGNAEERIKEDYLRILRMFRFHALYGKGKIPQDQIDACKKLRDGLDIISGERIRVEMSKLLASSSAEYSLSIMFETDILEKISALSNDKFEIDKIAKIYELDKNPNHIVSLAAILVPDITETEIEKISDRWKLSNKENNFLLRLRESLELDLKDDYQIRRSARINGKDEFYDYILLNYAKDRINKKSAKKLIEFIREFAVPDFPIKSDDIFLLGFKPGKQFGQALKEAEEIWEKSDYKYNKIEIIKKLQTAPK